ncbi:hypothetical protein H0H87_006669 [Tephrocybe sp. NHM501043]|nr:hypothetical protein H0H87_006669 [Tephrocybe sp. NHM501043]
MEGKHTSIPSVPSLEGVYGRSELRSDVKDTGSFSIVPGSNETDLRSLYCAFAISAMLNDWSAVDKDRAIAYIASCRTYEGGYGQAPFCEAHGGTTYIAVASLHLIPGLSAPPLTPAERQKSIYWLLSNHHSSGDLVDTHNLASFLASCQFKYGGIAKAPGEHPDPYHTYLSLAALAMYSPAPTMGDHIHAESWRFEPLDPLLNAREETSKWAKEHIPASMG